MTLNDSPTGGLIESIVMSTMTKLEILSRIRIHRPISLRHLERIITKLGIKPIGARQRPQLYPSDTAQRILTNLGFAMAQPVEVVETGGPPRIVSMNELRAERSKARKVTAA